MIMIDADNKMILLIERGKRLLIKSYWRFKLSTNLMQYDRCGKKERIIFSFWFSSACQFQESNLNYHLRHFLRKEFDTTKKGKKLLFWINKTKRRIIIVLYMNVAMETRGKKRQKGDILHFEWL